ncbi:MAG TPA: MarR family transcriptional regulator [Bryobacteraceae bacterium]|jgi:DNA-binding MarR family transcriptional regulator|nr:MarR family transcriptional regulator [Bryobacteraceae bacterium]
MAAADSLTRQAKAFIACSDVITELLTMQRRPRDTREPECSLAELRMLAALGRKQPVTMTELADALKAPLSTATRTADKLVKKGFVERRRASGDRRVVEVEFSRRGREINRFVARGRLAVVRKLLGAMPAPERARLIDGLSMMLAAREAP